MTPVAVGLVVEQYEKLGGDNAVKALQPGAESLPFADKARILGDARLQQFGGQAELDKILKELPYTAVQTPVQKAQALADWRDYQALGGHGEFFRLGGNSEDDALGSRLVNLRLMKEAGAVV